MPVAYNRVAGVVVTGNEDGAHAASRTSPRRLIDIGYTFAGQGWTYWNKGRAGRGGVPLQPEKDWTHRTGDAAAHNLVAVAGAPAGVQADVGAR